MGSTSALKPSSEPLAFHLVHSHWMSALTSTSVGDIAVADMIAFEPQIGIRAQLYNDLEKVKNSIRAPTELACQSWWMLLPGACGPKENGLWAG